MEIGKLYRSHRTFGFLRATTAPLEDGRVYAILQTDDHTEAATFAHMLLPVKDAEIEFDARMAMLAAIERARFLGLSNETIQTLFTEELSTPIPA
jgi:hypothetical protein